MAGVLTKKTINLALQGGGSHGAFTWGVLDRLLEEDRLIIEGISGASAGAMNGAALLQGYNSSGGAQDAQKTLNKFWEGIADLGGFEYPQSNLLTEMLGNWNAAMTDAMQRLFSPYQTNPFNLNPLRDLISKLFDVKAIQGCDRIKFFVTATAVETGKIKVFTRDELTIDVLMASACLPFTFHAVEIDGKPYWDGGYVGNPSIFPLIYNCDSPDIVIVQINPLLRPGTPSSPPDIINRLNEITFNTSLISEMRAISFVQRLIDENHLKPVGPLVKRMIKGASRGSDNSAGLKRMNMHLIEAEKEMLQLSAASKANVQRDFLLQLKKLGRTAADNWLQANWSKIGEISSIDIRERYL